MFHPCCRPISHPSHLLARKESDFISPMKLLAAGAVCTVRHCASSALRDEGGGRMGELSWQSSGKIAVCTLVAKALLTCAFGWCGRMPDPALCPEPYESCSCSPSASAGGCSFVSPACLCHCLAWHQARTTPAVVMHEGTRCYLRSTKALQACDNGIEAISVLELAGAALEQQPVPGEDVSKTGLAHVVYVTPLCPQWPPHRGEAAPIHLGMPSLC